MMQETTRGNEKRDYKMDIVEFSVVLVATSNNPSILNPDFLRYNGIVDESLQVKANSISTPVHSQVSFDGGVAVKADPERVIFEQTGDNLALDDIVCPKIAKRYLEKVPHALYRAIGINPKGFRYSEGNTADKVTAALIEKGAWMLFKDTIPDIQLKVIYHYEKRKILLDILEAKRPKTDGGQTSGILFQANIHRDIRQAKPPERLADLLSVIDSWKDDLSDFRAIAKKFNPRIF